ncbi:hypothetical protein BJ165DRAFT_1414092 [Panaeolus papilionaceus]|nr:hypothetical protein BJ165DRAFT_1414092 [Panaeolus papilionaceus]
MEIGAPMACLHLLGNPDHYTSHEFVCFYWKNFVRFIQSQWDLLLQSVDPNEKGTLPEHHNVTLYEWIQCADRHKVTSSRNPRQTLQYFNYLPDHPMSKTHIVACDPARRHYIVPNFIGGSLPRKDSGDREEYCLAMITLFVPWRTGIDLKAAHETWEDAFNKHDFSLREQQLMTNFNLRYECYDARDDFYATRQALGNSEIEQLEIATMWKVMKQTMLIMRITQMV